MLPTNENNLYFSICGGIASGKTTLAKLIKGLGFKSVFEEFPNNPFIQQFYSDPSSCAFETEITFLLQHYNQIKSSQMDNHIFICDFSLSLDLAYAHVTLKKEERDAFISVYNEVVRQISFPKKLFYLRCSPEVLLQRIRSRGRKYEEAISVEYLKLLDEALAEEVARVSDKTHVITLDTEIFNFANNESDILQVQNLLQKELLS